MRVLLDVEVTYAARRPWAPRRAQFADWATRALSDAAKHGAPMGAGRHLLSIAVVGATRSRTLNSHYRSKDRPTNVLSFGGGGLMPDGRQFLGELVMCAPIVAREAKSQHKSAASHWAHMTIHGILHLLGFDHERRGEARKMETREIQILDRLGFSDPYA